MKKFTLIIIFLLSFMMAKSQIHISTNPFEPDIAGSFSYPIVEHFYIGLWIEVDFPNEPEDKDFSSFMFDMKFSFLRFGKNVKINIYNGFSIGGSNDGFALAYYFMEDIYFKDFPVGIVIYQRFYGNIVGICYENRIGLCLKIFNKN